MKNLVKKRYTKANNQNLYFDTKKKYYITKSDITINKSKDYFSNVKNQSICNNGNYCDFITNVNKLAFTDNQNSKQFVEMLDNFANFIVFSVCKKIISASGDEKITKIKNDFAKNLNYFNELVTLQNNAYKKAYFNEYGNYITNEITNKDNVSAYVNKLSNMLCDGNDLKQVAILKFLNEIKKAKERNEKTFDIEKIYQIKALRKKVYISTTYKYENTDLYKVIDTSPIKEIYKAVRQYVYNNRTYCNNSKYIYISELLVDNDTNQSNNIYIRLPKYTQLAQTCTKDNFTSEIDKQVSCAFKSCDNVTANTQDIIDIDNVISQLQLSKQQLTILQYRLAGYGYKAIATKLGVKHNSIISQLKRIQDKYNKIISK